MTELDNKFSPYEVSLTDDELRSIQINSKIFKKASTIITRNMAFDLAEKRITQSEYDGMKIALKELYRLLVK